MELGILGTSIWQQNMPLLERLTIDRTIRPAELERLKRALGLDELVYLATCNRVEFIYTSATAQNQSRLLHCLIDFFFRGKCDLSFFPNDFYHFTGREAIVHLFRTASSLESLVVGETQITGQLKQAYQDAVETDLVGPNLGSLINEALQVAKRVKRETSIGVGCLSMASLAAQEMTRHLVGRTEPVIALVGAGPMTRKMAAYVNEAKLGKLLFINRTFSKAEQLAQEFSGTAMELADFLNRPVQVDAIISATASPDAVFDGTFLSGLSAEGPKVVCVDLAIPRDFSMEFGSDTRVILIDIPYLKSRGNGNLRQKFVEASRANEIVREAVTKYLADRVEIHLKPIFHDSFKESMEMAQRAMNNLFDQKLRSLNADERQAVMSLVTKLISHSSFQPVKMLSDRLAQARTEIDITDLDSQQREAV